MSILDLRSAAVDDDELIGDRLKTIHLSLDWILSHKSDLPWLSNAKLHDIGGIWQSIKKYGFVDAAKWDRSINGGQGGIVYGNGRHECLISILIEAKQKGEKPPRGIPTNDEGDWFVPLTVGVDQESEAMAIALGIDHNNLTYSGSTTGLTEMVAMWDQEGLIKLLTECADEYVMPVTMDEDVLSALLTGLDKSMPIDENDNQDSGDGDDEKMIVCPSCHHTWSKDK